MFARRPEVPRHTSLAIRAGEVTTRRVAVALTRPRQGVTCATTAAGIAMPSGALHSAVLPGPAAVALARPAYSAAVPVVGARRVHAPGARQGAVPPGVPSSAKTVARVTGTLPMPSAQFTGVAHAALTAAAAPPVPDVARAHTRPGDPGVARTVATARLPGRRHTGARGLTLRTVRRRAASVAARLAVTCGAAVPFGALLALPVPTSPSSAAHCAAAG